MEHEHYDQHFWRNGHTVRIVVFDDSSLANRYFQKERHGLPQRPVNNLTAGSR